MSQSFKMTEQMRIRLVELEYQDLPTNEFITEVNRIYLEEVGEALPASIKVLKSSDAPSLINDTSGYDGTAIHFQSHKNDIDEVYIISQGTQDGIDWDYNVTGLFAGIDYEQAEKTEYFTDDALVLFNTTRSNTKVTGLGHSLAHNNNTTAYLAYDTFDEVYGYNGAQTNYYQLFRADNDFKLHLKDKFSVLRTNEEAIYTLNQSELKKIAEAFYAEKADNIHQTLSTDDPLYWSSGSRGFFELGEIKLLDTNPAYGSLRDKFDLIPDDVMAGFQQFAVKYALAAETGDMEQFVSDYFDIDVALLKEIDSIGKGGLFYVINQKEVSRMIASVHEKLPEVMESFQAITTNANRIFGSLREAGYITKNQQSHIVTEINKINQELDVIYTQFQKIYEVRNNAEEIAKEKGKKNLLKQVVTEDIKLLMIGYQSIQSIMESLHSLNQDEYFAILATITGNHDLSGLLATLTDGQKSYINGDLIVHTTLGQKEIKVNLTQAIKVFHEGQKTLAKKVDIIRKLKRQFEREVFDFYEDERRKLVNRINDMEQNPNCYPILYDYRPTMTFGKIQKAVVHEYIPPLRNNIGVEEIIYEIEQSIENDREFIDTYLKSVTQLFDKELEIVNYFNQKGAFH